MIFRLELDFDTLAYKDALECVLRDVAYDISENPHPLIPGHKYPIRSVDFATLIGHYILVPDTTETIECESAPVPPSGERMELLLALTPASNHTNNPTI